MELGNLYIFQKPKFTSNEMKKCNEEKKELLNVFNSTSSAMFISLENRHLYYVALTQCLPDSRLDYFFYHFAHKSA